MVDLANVEETIPQRYNGRRRAFVPPYMILMKEDTPQHEHDLREVFNGLRWIVRTGSQWRLMPHDLPPWYTVYQQAQRGIEAGIFEDMVHDLRALLRLAKGKNEQPTAAIFDGRTVQSTPESGERAGYDGYKRKKRHFDGTNFKPCKLPEKRGDSHQRRRGAVATSGARLVRRAG